MGIVVVAFLAANALGGPPGAKITDTRSARCGSPAATAPRLRVPVAATRTSGASAANSAERRASPDHTT